MACLVSYCYCLLQVLLWLPEVPWEPGAPPHLSLFLFLSLLRSLSHTYTHIHTVTTFPQAHTQYTIAKIVLIYPASSINRIISNNCQRQLGSRLGDFILIDFLTCSQLRMIWFPSDTMFIKGILHKGINRYCWLDLYELWGNVEMRPLF